MILALMSNATIPLRIHKRKIVPNEFIKYSYCTWSLIEEQGWVTMNTSCTFYSIALVKSIFHVKLTKLSIASWMEFLHKFLHDHCMFLSFHILSCLLPQPSALGYDSGGLVFFSSLFEQFIKSYTGFGSFWHAFTHI